MRPDATFQPRDSDRRWIILGDLDSTILVEAAAGTGKTTCMVGRMVNLVGQGKCSIDSMAAVTFTRKAAAELRSRFQVELEGACRYEKGASRRLLEKALSGVDRCFVGTIHSFCAAMLRERPVEAAVDMDFQEMDEDEDLILKTQAWNLFLSDLYANGSPVLKELEDLGVEIGQLAPTFMTLSEYPDVTDWPAVHVEAPDPEPAMEALEELVRHMEQVSITLPEHPGTDPLIPKYRRIPLMFRQAARGGGLVGIMDLMEEFRSVRVVQKCWPGGKAQALEEQERWDSFRTSFAEPLAKQWREHRYAPLLGAIQPAMELYRHIKDQAGRLSYQDLLMKAAGLLRTGTTSAIRSYFRKRFSHVLVDEFQDTDPVQAEVIMLLTAENPEETDWRKCRPVPGSLFVVGDPKQSIYRFRRADIVTYQQVKGIIQQAGGKVVNLTANFRTTRSLVDWVNTTFEGEFGKFPEECSPQYVALDPVHDFGKTQVFPSVRYIRPPKDYSTNDRIREYEADIIVGAIRDAIDRGISIPKKASGTDPDPGSAASPDDFLIVTRNKEHLSLYSRKLQEMGIPHQVTGGKAMNQVMELALLHRCLVALTQPHNPVALVAVLRGELFGLSDRQLFAFKIAGGRFAFDSAVPEGLDRATADLFDDAFGRLSRYGIWLANLPPVTAMEKISADLGLIVRAAARPGGDVQAGSLMKAFELLRNAQRQKWSCTDIVEFLGRLVTQDEAHDAISARADERSAVRVMNLHKVKGLEAPVVFLADPTGKIKKPPWVRIDRSGDRVCGYLAIQGTERGGTRKVLMAQPRDWDSHADAEQGFRDAEEIRLLYVAATRAGCGLTVSLRSSYTNMNPWTFFEPALKGKPELTPGTEPRPPVAAPRIISSQDRSRAVQEIGSRWKRAVQPTYEVQAVKASTVQPGAFALSHGEHGTEWGSVIHLLLHAAMLDTRAEIQALAEAALTDADLSPGLTAAAVETVRSVMASDLWKRARAAQRCLVEVPFQRLLQTGSGDISRDTVVRGVIDLAFKETLGWVIADYKTDRVPKGRIKDLIDLYSPQVISYARAWSEITKDPIAEAGLYFTHTGEYVTVEVVVQRDLPFSQRNQTTKSPRH